MTKITRLLSRRYALRLHKDAVAAEFDRLDTERSRRGGALSVDDAARYNLIIDAYDRAFNAVADIEDTILAMPTFCFSNAAIKLEILTERAALDCDVADELARLTGEVHGMCGLV